MENYSPVDIRREIDALNNEIEQSLRPNQFILNNLIVDISQRIKTLQDICVHDYRDGYCIYCDKGED